MYNGIKKIVFIINAVSMDPFSYVYYCTGHAFLLLCLVFFILICLVCFYTPSFLSRSSGQAPTHFCAFSILPLVTITETSAPNYGMVFFIVTFFILSTIFYLILYYILNITRSINSYLSFILFLFILGCYIKGALYLGDSNPIYIENLPLISYYKYVLLSIISIIFISLWIVSFFSINIKNLVKMLTYPYVKEEMRRILYIWNDSFMGDLCCFLYNKIVTSNIFSMLFFFFHFFFFYFVRFITIGFLINFTFFHGDLRLLRYLLPLLLIIWLLSFVDYYFKIFREGTANYICDVLHVTYKGNITESDVEHDFISCNSKDLMFSLTDISVTEGFSVNDVDHLIKKWFASANITLKFRNYNQIINVLGIILLLSSSICWLIISYYFLTNVYLSNFFGFLGFRRITFMPIHNKFTRYVPPREARFVKEGSMNDVKQATGGAVSPGHPVIGEIEGDTFRIDCGITHGKGIEPNKSMPLSDQGIPPDKKPLNIVPLPNGPINVPKNHLKSSPIPNSTEFCESPHIKAKLDLLNKNKNSDSTSTETD